MKVKQGKIMLLSLIAAFITFFSLSLLNLTATSAHADDATVTQSAVALTQKTYGIDWETLYGKDGYVVIGDASATYYTDMQEGSNGTTAIKDTAWKYSANSLSSFTPKSDSLITTLTFGTVVWAANNDLQTYNLYKPGTNKTERLKTRAHQNSEQKYYADVFAGFTLKGDSATYVTLNVSDHNKKVSAEYPITISVYVSDRTAANGEAYANNANSDRYQTIDEFYAGKGGSPLATTTVTQQSANVTFKLQGAGEYRIVAYYNNPTAVDENGKMVATGTNSPLCPQINGFFFDTYIEPTIADVSLTLDGTIGLNFYTKTNNVENAAMKFTYADGTTETLSQPSALTDGYYKFTANVLPKNYAQKVKAELVSGDTVLDSVEYSVKDYCDYVAKNSSDEKLKSLCASLVNYGAAADNYFNESQNEISGATVTAEDVKDYQATAQGTAPEGVKVNEISLIIESETSIRLYITSSDGVAVKVNGIEAQIKTDSSSKYIEIANIAAKDLNNVYEIKFGTVTR